VLQLLVNASVVPSSLILSIQLITAKVVPSSLVLSIQLVNFCSQCASVSS
jgi:hypothetical protein